MKIYRTSSDEAQQRIAREAAEWGQAMRQAPTADERTAFLAWLEASPLHLREALLADCVDDALASTETLADFDLDALLASAAADANVVALHAPIASVPAPAPVPAPAVPPHAARATQRPRRRAGLRRWLHVAAVVGVLAVGVSLGWRAFSPVPAQVYASAIGERRVLQLADGSQVVLAPRSRISVAFSAGARDVDLVSGEADFQVAHDRARPFRVHAGPSIIQAVGTRFSVNRLPSGTVVSVSEGKVRMLAGGAGGLKAGLKAGMKAWLGRDEPAPVASRAARPLDPNASLKAGQAVKIALSGQAFAAVDYASTVDASAALPRLTFHEDTLADIVAEFNRYNPRQIVVADSAIRWQRYSGVFNANDADSFLQFLECCSSLAVIRDGEQTQVRARE